MAEVQQKAKKKTQRMDPLVASLMPESDKKMAGIAGISLVVALAFSLWASMYEAVVEEVIFEDSEAADLSASMTIEEKKKRKRKNLKNHVRKLVAAVSHVVRVSQMLHKLVVC